MPARDPAGTPLGRELARLMAAGETESDTFAAARRYSVDELAIWSALLPGARHAPPPGLCGRPNPVVVGDCVVCACFAPGRVDAFDRATGAPRWQLPLDYYGQDMTVGPANVILAPTARLLRAVRAESGEVLWTFATKKGEGEHSYSPPAWADGRVYLGDRAGYLYALDADTGRVIWKVRPSRAANNQINSGPVYHNGVVAVGSNAKLALGFDAATGRELWRRRLDGACGRVTTSGGEFVGATWRSAYRFRVADGEPIGRWHRRHHHVSAAAAAGDLTLLVTNREWPVEPRTWPFSELVAYRGGDELYRFNYPRHSVILLRYDAGRELVYESTYRGLGVLDPATGERSAVVTVFGDGEQFMESWSPPCVAGDVLYALVEKHESDGIGSRVVAMRHPRGRG